MSSIKDKYKEIIENTTDLSHINAIEQAVLGWRNTNFVKEYIPKDDIVPLYEQSELIYYAVAQRKAIDACKREHIASVDRQFLKDEDFKVALNDVKSKVRDMSHEEILESTKAHCERVQKNPNPDESAFEFKQKISKRRPKV